MSSRRLDSFSISKIVYFEDDNKDYPCCRFNGSDVERSMGESWESDYGFNKEELEYLKMIYNTSHNQSKKENTEEGK